MVVNMQLWNTNPFERVTLPAVRAARCGTRLATLGPQIVADMLDAGFIIDFHPASSTFRLFPPFVVSPREVDTFLQPFDRALVGRVLI